MRKALSWLVLLVLLVFVGVLVWTYTLTVDDYDGGAAAYKRGDYATAVRKWRSRAEQGDAVAQINLGGMYADGEGVPEDDAEAVKWYRLAAEQGSSFGQFFLGYMYYMDNGVPVDLVQAYAWFYLAAAQGHKHAVNVLKTVREEMTPTQRAEAQKLSKKLCAKIPGCVK